MFTGHSPLQNVKVQAGFTRIRVEGHDMPHHNNQSNHQKHRSHPQGHHHDPQHQDGASGADHDWGYKGKFGVNHWNDFCSTLSKHEEAHRQSPIDIAIKTAQHHKELKPINTKGFEDIKDGLLLKNNGHTAHLDLSACGYELTEGHLNGTYQSVQMHLHWGSESTRGSEHTIDGKQYAAELHVVFKHLGKKHSGKDLAVLGFLIDVSETDNRLWEHFLSHLPKITHQDMETKVDNFNLRSLLPDDLDHFFRYHGSLTTPPCSQTVNWTLYRDTIKLSERQLNIFRQNMKENKISDANERPMVDNFRPVQPLDGRNIHCTMEI
ncbi:unnamed protein product [Owenia fusiformis]|uniref:Carbonic anhydrase n=1 Tax=Owenia fusiformis TaxID=6347 RepID=A0A8J1TKX0_OWEFU|nr:unnamed protein product [Owenia fusiformis]